MQPFIFVIFWWLFQGICQVYVNGSCQPQRWQVNATQPLEPARAHAVQLHPQPPKPRARAQLHQPSRNSQRSVADNIVASLARSTNVSLDGDMSCKEHRLQNTTHESQAGGSKTMHQACFPSRNTITTKNLLKDTVPGTPVDVNFGDWGVLHDVHRSAGIWVQDPAVYGVAPLFTGTQFLAPFL